MKKGKSSIIYIFLPSLLEVFLIFIFALHLRFPVERSYLLWQHLVLGKLDITQHSLTTKNPFAYTPTGSLKRSSWLSDDILYLLHKYIGYRGLIVVKILILALLVMLPYYIYNEIDIGTYTLVAPIYLLLLTPGASLRPTLFSLLMFFLFTVAYYRDKPLFMGGITLFWSFIHGSYIIGMGILTLYLFLHYRKMKPSYILAFLLGVIPFVLPHSSLTLFTKLSSQKFILNTFDEWISPNFKNFLGIIYFIFLMLWVYINRKNTKNSHFFTAGVLLFLSLYARRFIPFFVVFSFPLIIRAQIFNLGEDFKGYLENTLKFPLWLLSFLVYFIFNAPGFPSYFIRKYHPYGCESVLQNNRNKNRILTLQAWVPYIYYATKGKFKFAVDATLTETDSIMSSYENFIRGYNCCKNLARLSPDIVVLPVKFLEKTRSCCRGCLKIEHIEKEFFVGEVKLGITQKSSEIK